MPICMRVNPILRESLSGWQLTARLPLGNEGGHVPLRGPPQFDHDRSHLMEQMLPPLIVGPAHEPHDMVGGVEGQGPAVRALILAGFCEALRDLSTMPQSSRA